MKKVGVLFFCAILCGCGGSEEKNRVDCGESSLTKKCDSILKSCEGRSFNFNPVTGAPTVNTGAVAACFTNEYQPVCSAACKSAR